MHQWRVDPICSANRAGFNQGESAKRAETARGHVVVLRPQQESYTLLSRQSLPSGKPIDELVLIPYMSRVLILSGKRTL